MKLSEEMKEDIKYQSSNDLNKSEYAKGKLIILNYYIPKVEALEKENEELKKNKVIIMQNNINNMAYR